MEFENIKCKIKSKIGILYSSANIEITSLTETFPFINRNKYIGLCVKIKTSTKSDILYIAHFSIVKRVFEKYVHLIRKDREELEETANWMNAYESICRAINKDILGIEIAKDSLYSMDLPRYLEKLFYENANNRVTFTGNSINV